MTTQHDSQAPEVPAAQQVPYGLRVAAAWTWRILVVTAGVTALLLLLDRLKVLGLAVFVALLLTALLDPLRRWLERHGVPHWLAVLLVVVGFLGLLVGAIALLANAIAGQFGNLSSQFTEGLQAIQDFLASRFGIDTARLQELVRQAWASVGSGSGSLVGGALSGATIALEVLSGAAIALFSTIFFLLDGPRIWDWVCHLFPARTRPTVNGAGARAWGTLQGYVLGTVLIALTDAVFIGLAIAIIGVPLALPLAILVFLFAFIPIVGATVSGFVAVVVALATQGPLAALLVLAAVIAVQQLEGHILQPLIMGRTVNVHPLGIVVAVTAGTLLAGIVGAVVAVPLAAVVTEVARYLADEHRARAQAVSQVAAAAVADPAAPPPVLPVREAQSAPSGDGSTGAGGPSASR